MVASVARNAVLVVNTYDVSSQSNDLNLPGSALTEDITVYGDVAEEFAGTIQTWSLDYKGLGPFDNLNPLNLDTIVASLLGAIATPFAAMPAGDVLASAGYAGYLVHIKANVSSPVKGVVRLDIAGQPGPLPDALVTVTSPAGLGREAVTSLHSRLTAEIATGSGSYWDSIAGSTEGAVGYLFVVAVNTLTSLDVAIQDSAATIGPWVDVVVFTTATGVTAERVEETPHTVARYLRANWTLVGTSATFLVLVKLMPTP